VTAQLLDGKSLSKTIRDQLKQDFAAFTAAQGVAPGLAVLRVGDDEASAGYARAIDKICQSTGAAYRTVELPSAVQQVDVAAAIAELNADPAVHGIMILEPLPAHIDHPALIDLMAPGKDVDGVHPLNAGRLLANRPPFFVPATPAGGLRLLEHAGVNFKGKHAVIVGRSDIVGKPMALLLLHRHCTVTVTHSRTVDLPGVCRSADILCLAIGRAEMVKGDWVKPGAIVVDFGTTYTDAGVKGDCEQVQVAEVAGMLTPVPGGTGPMTNVMLMENLLAAAKQAVQFITV
jgi:methylenetetrahydrofolate dehydrogenase (NADP+) / methenyltetrahydrofolate cyclohydrolase